MGYNQSKYFEQQVNVRVDFGRVRKQEGHRFAIVVNIKENIFDRD